MTKKIDLYPEAKAALTVLFITSHSPILEELYLFADKHLLFLRDNGLVDQTMEVITEEGLFYIELLKEELSDLKGTTNDSDITELAIHLGSHLKACLIILYLLDKASNPPEVIFTPFGYLDILAKSNLLTDLDYTLNSKGLQALREIGKSMKITKDKAEIQKLVDNLSDWQALTLKGVSEGANNHKTILPYHSNLHSKGLISSDYNLITQKGIQVLIRYDELHTRKLWKLLNT